MLTRRALGGVRRRLSSLPFSTLSSFSRPSQSPLSGTLQPYDPSQPVHNFSPGPTSLPREVAHQVRQHLLDHSCSGLSAMEISHRSPEFLYIKTATEDSLRRLLGPAVDPFDILFMHGGGHAQFAATPLNLCPTPSSTAHVFINGTWSSRMADEASKFCQITTTGSAHGWWQPPSVLTEQLSASTQSVPAFAYLCSNETVNGVEYFELPDLRPLQVPLVVDMSSDFCSKAVDWSRVDVAFSCAPKNIGVPGLTVVLVRRALREARIAQATCPGVLNWSIQEEHDSLWNTPATFNIFVTGLMFEWMERMGGLAAMERLAKEKARRVYDVVDGSGGFWSTRWLEHDMRSRMNVPFKISSDNGGEGRGNLTDHFVEAAFRRNIIGLKTLTPFGAGEYLRASLYNNVTLDDVDALCEMMRDFQRGCEG